MSAMVAWFVAVGHFFFFSLSSPENYNLTIFVVIISTPVLIHLIFIFLSFYRSFICLQFHHSIPIPIFFNLVLILLITFFAFC